jgi:hypothetical protein
MLLTSLMYNSLHNEIFITFFHAFCANDFADFLLILLHTGSCGTRFCVICEYIKSSTAARFGWSEVHQYLYHLFYVDLRERDHLEDLVRDGIIRTWDVVVWTD